MPTVAGLPPALPFRALLVLAPSFVSVLAYRTSLTWHPVVGLDTGPAGRTGNGLLWFTFGALTSVPCYGHLILVAVTN